MRFLDLFDCVVGTWVDRSVEMRSYSFDEPVSGALVPLKIKLQSRWMKMLKPKPATHKFGR